jgi:ATP-binding cassette subfamily B protein IrtA
MAGGTFKILWFLIKQQKLKISLSALLSVLSAGLTLVPLIIVCHIATVLMEPPPYDQGHIYLMAGLAILAVAIRFLCTGASAMFSHIAAYDLLYAIRVRILNHLGHLPLGYFQEQNSGTLKKIMGEDVERMELFLAHHIPDLTSSIVLPVITLIYLFTQDLGLALAALAPLFLAILVQSYSYRGYQPRLEQWQNALARMNASIIEYVQNIRVIKAFNQTVGSYARFKSSLDDFYGVIHSWANVGIRGYTLFQLLISAGLYFIFPVGIWLFLGGNVEIPTLVLFLLLGVGFMAPLNKLVRFAGEISLMGSGVNRIVEVLDEKPLTEPSSAQIPQEYSVEFQDVTFAYGDNEVLHNISFTAEQGKITALVGPSGAGKTTVAQLIPRFWDVPSGRILIGGVDIKNIPTHEVMKQASFVFQDVFLFNDTVTENIRMSSSRGVTDEEVMAAARAAQAHAFISGLPQGYQTQLGERGARLSGGEKQRIAIARAILRDTPIVIMDEATAFADPQNEARIQTALSELMRRKTVIIIAHRLSTITEVDKIVVLDKGRVVGEGRHEELLKKQPLYRAMWQAHTAASEWDLGTGGVPA